MKIYKFKFFFHSIIGFYMSLYMVLQFVVIRNLKKNINCINKNKKKMKKEIAIGP